MVWDTFNRNVGFWRGSSSLLVYLFINTILVALEGLRGRVVFAINTVGGWEHLFFLEVSLGCVNLPRGGCKCEWRFLGAGLEGDRC